MHERAQCDPCRGRVRRVVRTRSRAAKGPATEADPCLSPLRQRVRARERQQPGRERDTLARRGLRWPSRNCNRHRGRVSKCNHAEGVDGTRDSMRGANGTAKQPPRLGVRCATLMMGRACREVRNGDWWGSRVPDKGRAARADEVAEACDAVPSSAVAARCTSNAARTNPH